MGKQQKLIIFAQAALRNWLHEHGRAFGGFAEIFLDLFRPRMPAESLAMTGRLCVSSFFGSILKLRPTTLYYNRS